MNQRTHNHIHPGEEEHRKPRRRLKPCLINNYGCDHSTLAIATPTLFTMASQEQEISCAPLPTGGHDCDFVESPSDSLECPVCLLVLREPHLLSCCGVKICHSCISGVCLCVHEYIMTTYNFFYRSNT